MIWFKHYADVSHSVSITNFRRKVGREGMCRYWDLLEFLCNKFDGECTNFVLPRETLRTLFGFRNWSTLGLYADYLGTVAGLSLTKRDLEYEIEAPILLELMGRDFKKARAERVGTAPKIKKKNKDKDKREITQKGTKKVPTKYTTEFELLWEKWPRKIDPGKKSDAFRNFTKLAETEILEVLIKSAEHYMAYVIQKETDQQFINKLSNFFGQSEKWKGFKTAPLVQDPDSPNGVGMNMEKFDVARWEQQP